jgi:uncharacterized protein (DUF2336 family)
MVLIVSLAVLLAGFFGLYRWGLPRLLAKPGAGVAPPRIRTIEQFPIAPAWPPAAAGPAPNTGGFGQREQRATATRLSEAEVAALLGSAARPEDAALRLGRNVADDGLGVEERAIAEQLLWRLMDHESVAVREVIAETLQRSHNLPHDLALRLIEDVDSVALPVLRFSPSVLPEDLIAVVRGGSFTRQIAIASRDEVPSTVAGALVDTENNRAVSVLVANPGAALDSTVLERVAEKFGADPAVAEVLEHHPNLPPDTAALLRRFSVTSLIKYLAEQPGLTETAVANLVLRTLDEWVAGPDGQDYEAAAAELAAYLQKAGKLSPLLIRRALCGGEIELYEHAMAARAGIPVANARALLHDGGGLGPASLHDKSGIPLAGHKALRIGVDVLRHAAASGRSWSREELQTEVLRQLSAEPNNPCPDEISFLRIRLNPAA